MRQIVSVLLLLLSPAPALAKDACDFYAFSLAEHPQEAEIRAEPNASSPVVGILPEYTLKGGTFNGAEFRVVEMRDGWAQITDVRGVDRKRSAGPEGWIDGAYVDFFVFTQLAFAEPDENSAIVTPVRIPFVFEFRDCRGEWAKISFDRLALPRKDRDKYDRSHRFEGWVRGVCGVPELGTCEGVYGDKLPQDPTAVTANP